MWNALQFSWSLFRVSGANLFVTMFDPSLSPQKAFRISRALLRWREWVSPLTPPKGSWHLRQLTNLDASSSRTGAAGICHLWNFRFAWTVASLIFVPPPWPAYWSSCQEADLLVRGGSVALTPCLQMRKRMRIRSPHQGWPRWQVEFLWKILSPPIMFWRFDPQGTLKGVLEPAFGGFFVALKWLHSQCVSSSVYAF